MLAIRVLGCRPVRLKWSAQPPTYPRLEVEMKAAVEKRPPSEVSTLQELIFSIRANLQKGEDYYREAGRDLIKAKRQVPTGQWYEWLDENFHLSISTALYYMKLATGARARAHKLEPNKRLLKNIHKIAGSNLAAMRRDAEDRESERKIVAALAAKIVSIGYKVLAAKMHPDVRGGSKEAFQRLNEAKRQLMEAL